ncbi:MAG: PQQ-binding-like beta-propeller repeat protein [Pirellulales bacterium]
MSRSGPAIWTICAISLAALFGHPAAAPAQFASAPDELSDSIDLDQADSAVRTHLERVRAFVADRQWDEAVETLRQVMETHGSKVIALTPTRYVNLTDYCHVQIAALPAEALALYRQRVDALAENWYEVGRGQRDAGRLADVVDQMFCSTWGDDALWALGEIELEKGNCGAARTYWSRLIEVPPARVAADRYEAARGVADLPAETAALLDKWYVSVPQALPPRYELQGDGVLADDVALELVQFWKERRLPPTRLAYPATDIPRADIRARLVLVSIMEGSLDRAREEVQALVALHPDAQGRLAGRDVKYAEALAAMIADAAKWPTARAADDWPTFAGDFTRTKSAARGVDLGTALWPPIDLGEPLSADSSNSRAYSLRRIGEDAYRLLSYHPVVAGDLVLLNNQRQIFAFNIHTGRPAWPSDDETRPAGEIYADKSPLGYSGRVSRGIGVPRFTMTVHGGKLFARMGSSITSRPLEALDSRTGYLLCLDLEAQGRAVWKPDGRLLPDDDRWAFEGSPVVDGENLYVAMRKSDVRPQAHVACFDVATGRRRWRTMVCAAETAAGGQFEEMSHNLLTLDQGTLYYNSNLGAVAALAARDGRLQWVSLYPRARKAMADGRDRRTAHFYRDLTPCVYYRGTLLAAPADCESIVAFDAGSGETIWVSQLPEDVVHLLGVGHGNLLASGDSLWWIDARRGKVLKHWPDTTPLGYGRGILAGDQVVWPTRDALYVFDQAVTPGRAVERDPIRLTEAREATGGNLIAAHGVLLIATADKLYAFQQNAAGRPQNDGADATPVEVRVAHRRGSATFLEFSPIRFTARPTDRSQP